jgi:two-component system sensor histidine kinase PilS (NtrC family)
MSAPVERRQRQDPTPHERRRYDRRRTDRRRVEPALPEESWFGALGVGGETELPSDGWADESQFIGGWPQQPPQPTDSRFLSRQARRIVSQGASTFQRIYRLFVGARAALGIALLLAQTIGNTIGVKASLAMLGVSALYALQAVLLWLLPRLRPQPPAPPVARLTRAQWAATVGFDLLAFTTLHVLETAPNFNYVALLVLPVLMAGVLLPRLIALATAAGVALMLLGTAWRAALIGGDVAVPLTQAGLAGIGFFVITLLAGELAGRLAREELTARGSLELARQQAQLNRLVIEEMADGVLVVDRRSRVRAANPAARKLLVAHGVGAAAPFQLQGQAAWARLAEAVGQAFDERAWPEQGRDVALAFDGGATRTLRVRARFTRRRPLPADAADAPEELCVLFLEDLRSVQARNRQEKLAAMGRVSAGIAHEIRNPLAAIAQANGLLQEDATTEGQARLAAIVADNVERLKRIVDDVMEVAPGAPPTLRAINVCHEVAATVGEWARTVQLPLGEGSRLHVELPRETVGVLFDPDHLRRVLVNLLDNARRHASDAPGAVQLVLTARDAERTELSVASDGPPIPADVERHLFEPFFSTRSRGTGLGLYICKELCERYGGHIEYRLRPEGRPNRNEFVVTMRRAALPLETARP